MNNTQNASSSNLSTVDRRAKRILISLGISSISIGCDFIRVAIKETYLDPQITEYISKTLYPRVTRLCGTRKISTVQRDMLRAIEKPHSPADLAAAEQYLGSGENVWSVKGIVDGIAHYLRREDGLE